MHIESIRERKTSSGQVVLVFQVLWFERGISVKVTYDHKALIIDGKRRILQSGSVHYPRTTPEVWPQIIQKAKEGGLDVIESYVFWNYHEPVKGEYYFEGRFDLVRFVKAVQEAGLFVHLRIGPYACAEWNYGISICDFIGVKKALIAVSRRLQDSPPSGRAYEVDPQEILADGRMDVPPVRSFVPQPNSGTSFNHAPGRPYTSDADQHPNTNLRMPQQEVTFRILCSHERVGVIIGKQGMVVRALQNESGASINVASPVPDCKERLVTITATENADSQYSAAQNAVILVFNKSTDAGYSKGIDSGGKRSHVAAQVVVSSNQVGCLLGKGGAIISEMRRATGAYMRIIGGDEVPKFISENDQVVQQQTIRDSVFMGEKRMDAGNYRTSLWIDWIILLGS
ncbi:hypothetical protein POM88_019370 [Heracleum sosnowskyi]|uniref:beta-galactosidase n=1 Tax=Heracleum sosnowskyi TaxID=360622 RepID=A0AAD8IS86_9APIA|nr:hypothetical protein POM88_019370 [Heracleum sosnowskyi]